jgi:hypothetical protein
MQLQPTGAGRDVVWQIFALIFASSEVCWLRRCLIRRGTHIKSPLACKSQGRLPEVNRLTQLRNETNVLYTHMDFTFRE